MVLLDLQDSRRLTGANLVTDGPGAVIDVTVEGMAIPAVIAAWKTHAAAMMTTLGWTEQRLFVRAVTDGASLAISAPVDVLYAATEVNEWAWEATVAELTGAPAPEHSEAAGRLSRLIEEERNPPLLSLQAAAAEHGVTFLSDDDEVSVGTGKGSRTWPVADVPEAGEVLWEEIHDIPVVLVTGTNGKTTTVRLLAAMVRAGGRAAGFSSTDGVFVDDELVDGGDYSGPGGARMVLRDRRVDAAILETARGGMLRRGLGTPRAKAAMVTNISIDHVGEYGVSDVEGIAEAKLVVGKALAGGGTLVLNADDPVLAKRTSPAGTTLVLTSRQPGNESVSAHLQAGGCAFVVEKGHFVRREGSAARRLLSVPDVPLTLAGAARYNVANVLGALALAPHLGVSDEDAARALRDFHPTPANIPGRMNLFDLNGVTIVVDYAHNPHGMDALVQTVLRMPATRRLIVIGQAGDRDEGAIRHLVRSATAMKPERVIVKEMQKFLRGREAGAVPAIIRDELRRIECRAEVTDAPGELEAVRVALEWCEPGDLLVLPIQEEREAVLALLEDLTRRGWRAGEVVG